jgi:CheY-like chemotaxis protein
MKKPIVRRDLVRIMQELDQPAIVEPEPEPAPVEEVPEPAPVEEVPEPDAQDGRVMRVLAAEDNRTNRLVFGKMVKHLNIELRFAENGREAVEAYREFRPDMIFMDISMPEMDGKEATRTIREIEADAGGTTHVPVVALTAHAMDGDDTEILAAGLDYYLTKPLRKAAITEKVLELAPDFVLPVLPEESIAI